MHSHFRFVYFVIWTTSLTCVTQCAPTGKTMLDTFIEESRECPVLDFVILPAFKSDSGSLNISPNGDYDLSVPLEICTTAQGIDSTAVPMCNEAFEIIRNLSICRNDLEVLKKAIPSSFRVNTSAQVDSVCKDFSARRSILSGNNESVAFKLSDIVICRMVCQEKVSKACAFLLWGYRAQSKINDALRSSVFPNQDVTVSGSTEPARQNEEHISANVGGPPGDPQEEQQHVGLTAGKEIQFQAQEHETTKLSVAATKTSGKSSEPEPPPKTKTSESSNVKLKQHDSLKDKLAKAELPQKKSEVFTKDIVNDQKSVAKSNVSNTTVAGKSTAVSLSNAPENGDAQHVVNRNTAKSVSFVAKISTASSTTSAQPHNDILINTEEKPNSDNVNALTEVSKSSGGSVDVGKENKGKDASQSDSADPVEDYSDRSLVNEDPKDAEEEITLNVDIKDHAKSKVKSGLPSGLGNNPKPMDTSEEKLDSANVAHDKTPAVTVTKEMSLVPSELDPKMMSNPSNMHDPPELDTEDRDNNLDQPFHMGNSEGDYTDEIGQSSIVNDGTFPVSSRTGAEVSSMPEKPETQPKTDPQRATDKSDFPGQEDPHFFFYFVTIVIFAIGGYVLFHNKQKIFALIIEGRHERRRRSGASYRKLETK